MTDESASPTFQGFSAIIETQKRLVQSMGAIQNVLAETQRTVERFGRDVIKLREEQVGLTAETRGLRQEQAGLAAETRALRQELTDRFAAVGRRFDEIENAIDAVRDDIRGAKSDIISQEIQTLSAVQEALTLRSRVESLADSLQDVRARLDM